MPSTPTDDLRPRPWPPSSRVVVAKRLSRPRGGRRERRPDAASGTGVGPAGKGRDRQGGLVLTVGGRLGASPVRRPCGRWGRTVHGPCGVSSQRAVPARVRLPPVASSLACAAVGGPVAGCSAGRSSRCMPPAVRDRPARNARIVPGRRRARARSTSSPRTTRFLPDASTWCPARPSSPRHQRRPRVHEAIIGDWPVQDAWEVAEAATAGAPPGPTPLVSVPPERRRLRVVVQSGRAVDVTWTVPDGDAAPRRRSGGHCWSAVTSRTLARAWAPRPRVRQASRRLVGSRAERAPVVPSAPHRPPVRPAALRRN
jgi:hypothetical protein